VTVHTKRRMLEACRPPQPVWVPLNESIDVRGAGTTIICADTVRRIGSGRLLCDTPPRARPGNAPERAQMNIVDISQGWYEGMHKFDADWYPDFSVERRMTPSTDPARKDRTFSHLHIFPHNGTHVESAYHFDPDGARIATVPLEVLIGRAIVADLSGHEDLQPVTGEDLEAAVSGTDIRGNRLLIRTDHPRRHLGQGDYWDTPPYLAPTAAEWIIERGVSLVGMDCIAEKPGDPDFPIHRRILGSGIPILENISNLHLVSETVVWLFAAPIMVGDVEAAPARAVVIEGTAGLGG
jgi:arylformamidase